VTKQTTTSYLIEMEVLHQALDDAWNRRQAQIHKLEELLRANPDSPAPLGLLKGINDTYREINSYMDRMEQLMNTRFDQIVLDE
jgi:hypothetical protein